MRYELYKKLRDAGATTDPFGLWLRDKFRRWAKEHHGEKIEAQLRVDDGAYWPMIHGLLAHHGDHFNEWLIRYVVAELLRYKEATS